MWIATAPYGVVAVSIFIPNKGVYRCLILDEELKFSRFQGVKKERRVTLFVMS